MSAAGRGASEGCPWGCCRKTWPERREHAHCLRIVKCTMIKDAMLFGIQLCASSSPARPLVFQQGPVLMGCGVTQVWMGRLKSG